MRKFLNYLIKNKFTVYAASLTYYAFLGIIPYAFVAIRIFAALGLSGADSSALSALDSGGFLSAIIARTNAAKTGESVISFLVTFYSSTTCFYQLKKISAGISNDAKPKNAVILRVASALVMLAVQLVFVLSAVVGVVADKVFDKAVYAVLTYFLTLVCVYLSIVIVNFFAVKSSADSVFLGSLVVLAFWTTATAAFNLYINLFADFSRLYGAFSFVVVFFIWLYLLMTGLVTGVLFISYGQNQLVSPRE